MSDQRAEIRLEIRCAHLEDQNTWLHHVITVLADAAHQTPYERDAIDRLLALIDELAA